ncbi:MAG TPA: glycosyltransferase [Candidatus Binataceae bacterium]|nr:glycosyltransferase [Candidatus Binataceae bacterium]
MRVLHIDPAKLYGGVETFLVTLARYRLLCPEMEPEFAVCFEGRLAAELATSGVWIHRLSDVRVRNPLSILRARQRLARLAVAHHVEVFVCHMPWSQALFGPVARKLRLPLVFWQHSATLGRHWLERWANLTPPDRAVAPSRFVAATVPNIFPRLHAEAIYYPVPAPPAYTDEQRLAVRRELNVAPESVVIVQAGRLSSVKGYKDHILALGRLHAVPSWTCWIIGGVQQPGERAYLKELKETALRLGIGERVRFLGQRSDVSRLLAAADIYCQPNTGTEGLPVVFGEAMHARLPIVSTRIGGFDELVDDSCGALATPGDYDAIARYLGELIADPDLRARQGASGQHKVERVGDPATQLNRIYQLVLSARQGTEPGGQKHSMSSGAWK